LVVGCFTRCLWNKEIPCRLDHEAIYNSFTILDMYKSLAIFSFIAIISCGKTGSNNQSDQQVETKTECLRKVSFGDIDFCLPQIEGMTECYSTPKVKERADAFNYEGNTILGYYLNNETYQQMEVLDSMSYDDYGQVYVTNNLKGIKVGQAELAQMANTMGSDFIQENWSDMQKKLEHSYDDLSIGTPVLVENYSPNSKVKSFVMLSKIKTNRDEAVMLMTLNIIEMKERLIWLAYYKFYDGEESIKQAKSKNDFIIGRLMEVNK
jgi:hypothetical protein